MSEKPKEKKWTFAAVRDEIALGDFVSHLPRFDDLYKRSLNSRETKRKMYQEALNAALENLMSWERVARADGFDIVCATDIFQGAPHPEINMKDGTVTFVQAYGVMVKEKEANE